MKTIAVLSLALAACIAETQTVAPSSGSSADDATPQVNDRGPNAADSEAVVPAADELSCQTKNFDDYPKSKHLTSFTNADELTGYKDAAGNVVIKPTFIMGYEFNQHGIAAAMTGQGQTVFIDASGNTIAKALTFDNGPDYFVAGRARIKSDDGKIGFIAEDGTIVVQPTYQWATPFCRGRSVVCLGCVESTRKHDPPSGGKWGYIDRSGALVVPLKYDVANPFTADSNLAKVIIGDTMMWIGPDGQKAEPPQ